MIKHLKRFIFYAKKRAIELQELIDAIEYSSKTKAEIFVFLGSKS